MQKSLHELITYIWIPFMLGFVAYIFQGQHDLPLAIVLLIAFSALYTLVRVYFAKKDWRFLAASALVIAGVLGFVFLRPQGITLIINGQPVIGSSIAFNEGSVTIYPAPGADGKYAKATMVTLTANPATDYEFKNWMGTSNNITNPATVTMGGKQQVTVTFEARPALIINNQPVIGAIVSFNEGSVSIRPPPEKDGKYVVGTTVTLTASPNTGFDWAVWSATDNNSTNPTIVTMSSQQQITVSFQPRSLLYINNQVVSDVVMSIPDGGSVRVNPGPGNDDKYAKGTIITLTAKPDAAYGFKTWSGTSDDGSNPTRITINSDKHVSVTFELRFPISINNVSANSSSVSFPEGSVSLSPAPLPDNRYAINTPVTLTAQPASGYRFDHWSGDISGTSASVSVTMNSGKNVIAVFIKTYGVTNTVNGTGGSVALSPPGGTYDAGSTVILTATPDNGYRFDRWSGDASGTSPSVTITMNSDKTTSASFKKVFNLTTAANPVNSGNVTPSSGTFDDGTVVTISAQPASGYVFDHWGGDASGNVTSANITMSANKSVTAFFKSKR